MISGAAFQPDHCLAESCQSPVGAGEHLDRVGSEAPGTPDYTRSWSAHRRDTDLAGQGTAVEGDNPDTTLRNSSPCLEEPPPGLPEESPNQPGR